MFVGGIRRSIGVVLLGIALFVGFARPAHAAQQSTSDAEATLTADLNQERTSRGLASLTTAPDLVAYADLESWPKAVRVWLRDFRREDGCSICSPDSTTPGEVQAT